MMFTSKSGKVYSSPQYGKMMDGADSAPESKQKTLDVPSKDSKVPVIRIVISTAPDGNGYTSDSGDGVDTHPDVSSLLSHIQGSLPPDAAPDADDAAALPPDAAAPAPSTMDSVKKMIGGK
jgi:hypothetical protein